MKDRIRSFEYWGFLFFFLIFLGAPVEAAQANEQKQEKASSLKQIHDYEKLSPFEFKNILIDIAMKSKATNFLNAGRGNPNFLNTTVRKAHALIEKFGSEAAKEKIAVNDLGLRLDKQGLAEKFKRYLSTQDAQDSGVQFLNKALQYAEKDLKFNPDDFVFELVDNILGDFYPSPPRVSILTGQVVNAYLAKVLFQGDVPPDTKFDFFATEGATAAMVYTFKSLNENMVIKKGDKIAILTPIFSPYLEIPALNDYELVQVHVESDEELGWQVPDSEAEKLLDKNIKALFLVNPTNPTSVSLSKETVNKIAHIVKTKRQDLIVLTDTVYATFVNAYYTLLKAIPENTICVYSYSKYFGVTGWRLGVIMLNEKNVIDEYIKKLPDADKKLLAKRYSIDAVDPAGIKFIDRLLMDSRDVALAHTGGISGPQQGMMCLLSLFELIDTEGVYKKSIRSILNKRIKNLYAHLGITPAVGENKTHYYALLNLKKVADKKYGAEFSRHFDSEDMIYKFLLALAKEKAVVCLPGKGFAGPASSIRVSLANLDDDAYTAISKAIDFVMKKFYQELEA